MHKRIIALALCLLLTAALFPVTASAVTAEEQEIRREIVRDYQSSLAASEKESLGGFCGLMTSWQLFFMGINRYLLTYDGNQQYDAYCNLEMTTGGHRVRAYSAEEYSLEEALNMVTNNGTRNAYNILVGFQWTNTEAGATYGHAVVIYAILDGMVYFTEGFQTSFGTMEGQAIALSIRDFANYYDDWTIFEGVIVFGKKDYVDNCALRRTYLFGQALEEAKIYSQPCTPNMDVAETTLLRTTLPGERLLVTGVMENTWSQHFYRVDDGGTVGYVPAEQLMPVRFNYEDLTASNVICPEALEEGQSFEMGGTVYGVYSGLSDVTVVVHNQEGRQVLHRNVEAEDAICSLDGKTIDLSHLKEGWYTYSIYANAENRYASGWFLESDENSVCVLSQPFCVGDAGPYSEPAVQAVQVRALKNGWVWEQNKWYYYENDVPRTGWFCDDGVDYYLQEDGSAATGWQLINGKNRYFSSTGAMRTGWMETEKGTCYLLNNGEPAVGWHVVRGRECFFSQEGILTKIKP